MAKREFIDKKAFIDRSAIEFVSLEDSFRYMEWSKNNEVQLEMVATTTTEQEIVKPYLEKLRVDIEAVYDELDGYDPDSLGTFANRIDDLIDNLLSESEGKK